MFTREQTDALRSLSIGIFNKPNEWKKILSDKRYQVVYGYQDDVNYKKYTQIPTQKKGKFEQRIVPLKKDEEIPKVPMTRPMNFEELERSLIAVLEMQNFAALYKENEYSFYEEVANRYYNNVILNKPFLSVKEDEKDKFDNYFKELPEEYQKDLEPYVVVGRKGSGFTVEGIRFVLELKNLLNPTKTEE